MKVMLVDPPGYNQNRINRVLGSFGTQKANQFWPPYDLQIIAGYCKKNGHDFKILDANNLEIDFKEVGLQIKEYDPDWVIYLTCFPSFLHDYNTAITAKSINPAIKTACVSLSMLSVQRPKENLEKMERLDFIVWGEPEHTIMELINGKKPSEVKGIYYRNKKGKINFTGISDKIHNLDLFGIPVHSCMDYRLYSCPMAINLPMAIMECSRGCVNRCIHCQAGSFQSPIRTRSIHNISSEMVELKKIGIKEIKFWDCTLPNHSNFIYKLCTTMIKKNYNFSWHCNSRAEFINENLVKLMKKAGCHTIAIGCESSDSKILKDMGKNETPEQIDNAIRVIKKYGMRVMLYVTFGLRGETEETMRRTFEFVKKRQPDITTFGMVVPAPGTPFYEYLKKRKLLIVKKLELQDPNYLPAFNYPLLSSKKIYEFSRAAYRRYYFNPSYIFMKIKKLKSLTELKINFYNAMSIIKRYFFEKAE